MREKHLHCQGAQSLHCHKIKTNALSQAESPLSGAGLRALILIRVHKGGVLGHKDSQEGKKKPYFGASFSVQVTFNIRIHIRNHLSPSL